MGMRGGVFTGVLWGAVVGMMLMGAACTAESTTAPAGSGLETVKVELKGKGFVLEVARTDAERERGLMDRKSMPADHGMIFVFDEPGYYRFWMKNTEIPLDIVFLDAKGKVLAVRTMKPHDETPIGPDAPEEYAIELNAGVAKGLGLEKGDVVRLPEKVVKGGSHSDEK